MTATTLKEPITIAEIPLGSEVLRVEVKALNGRAIFSAWRFYRNSAGELKPTRQGLACSLERLPEVVAAVADALARARMEGLIEDQT